MHLWGVLYTESMAESRQISDGLLAGLHDPAVRREAFDAVVGAWLRPLYWHVRRLVVVHEDAEDVVQESFVKAYDALDSFRGGAAELRVWLYRIATRTALSLLRRRRRGLFSSLDDVSRELADRVSEECGDAAEEALVRFQQAVLNLRSASGWSSTSATTTGSPMPRLPAFCSSASRPCGSITTMPWRN